MPRRYLARILETFNFSFRGHNFVGFRIELRKELCQQLLLKVVLLNILFQCYFLKELLDGTNQIRNALQAMLFAQISQRPFQKAIT